MYVFLLVQPVLMSAKNVCQDCLPTVQHGSMGSQGISRDLCKRQPTANIGHAEKF